MSNSTSNHKKQEPNEDKEISELRKLLLVIENYISVLETKKNNYNKQSTETKSQNKIKTFNNLIKETLILIEKRKRMLFQKRINHLINQKMDRDLLQDPQTEDTIENKIWESLDHKTFFLALNFDPFLMKCHSEIRTYEKKILRIQSKLDNVNYQDQNPQITKLKRSIDEITSHHNHKNRNKIMSIIENPETHLGRSCFKLIQKVESNKLQDLGVINDSIRKTIIKYFQPKVNKIKDNEIEDYDNEIVSFGNDDDFGINLQEFGNNNNYVELENSKSPTEEENMVEMCFRLYFFSKLSNKLTDMIYDHDKENKYYEQLEKYKEVTLEDFSLSREILDISKPYSLLQFVSEIKLLQYFTSPVLKLQTVLKFQLIILKHLINLGVHEETGETKLKMEKEREKERGIEIEIEIEKEKGNENEKGEEKEKEIEKKNLNKENEEYLIFIFKKITAFILLKSGITNLYTELDYIKKFCDPEFLHSPTIKIFLQYFEDSLQMINTFSKTNLHSKKNDLSGKLLIVFENKWDDLVKNHNYFNFEKKEIVLMGYKLFLIPQYMFEWTKLISTCVLYTGSKKDSISGKVIKIKENLSSNEQEFIMKLFVGIPISEISMNLENTSNNQVALISKIKDTTLTNEPFDFLLEIPNGNLLSSSKLINHTLNLIRLVGISENEKIRNIDQLKDLEELYVTNYLQDKLENEKGNVTENENDNQILSIYQQVDQTIFKIKKILTLLNCHMDMSIGISNVFDNITTNSLKNFLVQCNDLHLLSQLERKKQKINFLIFTKLSQFLTYWINQLKKLGFEIIQDPMVNSNTFSEVIKKLQLLNNLNVDGRIGVKTRKKIAQLIECINIEN
ncbi:nnp-1 protein putative nuclear protein 1 nop52 [Anaeramoeba flamelloides]|uniref:Nnp-1 protein putative nuclear protein 1 nop52 n=1 Tax=Anaeramoeba flamelloides TaxID=1746091 RepID=A0AAV7Y6C0_9EUKA|nr:nnp-1 protein putative nuclear protein 1 nop52 [Anaeramoeba flamelloides]